MPQGKMVNSAVVRNYKLKLYGNKTKTDTAKYTIKRFNEYVNMFCGRAYFGQKVSTKGMGILANQSQYKAFDIINKQRKSAKITGCKTNVPYIKNEGCRAILQKPKNSKFDYWISIINQWGGDRIILPAKSHKALNKALRQGWKFMSLCECKIINGNLYVIVFVKRDAPKIKKCKRVIGCDVGIKHSVVTSDGYLGYGLSKVMKVQKARHAERRRQGHKVSSRQRTYIKQILDREAKLVLRRSQKHLAYLAVESPKRLANLRSGSLQGWARSYFANRLTILGRESGVMVIEVSPYQTSITCPKCGTVDKESRATRDIFKCVSCNHSDHADRNAALNVAMKGILSIKKDKS